MSNSRKDSAASPYGKPAWLFVWSSDGIQGREFRVTCHHRALFSSAANLQYFVAYSRTQDQTARVYLSLWSRRTGMIGWSCHQLVLLQAVARWRCEQCVMERWTAVNTLPLHRLYPLPSPGANMWHKLNYTERQSLCLLISWIRNENKAWFVST